MAHEEVSQRAEVHWVYTVYGSGMDTPEGRRKYEQEVSEIYEVAGTDLINGKKLLAQVSMSTLRMADHAVLFQLIVQGVDADLVEKQKWMQKLSGPQRTA